MLNPDEIKRALWALEVCLLEGRLTEEEAQALYRAVGQALFPKKLEG